MGHKVDKLKVLLLEGIHPVAKSILESEGFAVDLEKKAYSEAELIGAINNYDLIGIRSKTKITDAVFKKSKRVQAIGAFCIGTNQVDLNSSNHIGVPVFNAPYSNTRSVAEMVIAEMIALSRQLVDRSVQVHQGTWTKSAVGAKEVRGKTLGIVGYGHIGSQVSIMAESLGLRVVFYDIVKKLPLGNTRQLDSLNSLLEISDFVTLHVPETEATKNMISEYQLRKMKKGAYLINASRGSVVDIVALASSLREGHVAGAAVDVFPEEPESNEQIFKSELQGVSNVILTPHIGGSTEEAQEAIGQEVADRFIRFIKNGSTRGAVNFPNVDLPVQTDCHRILNVHKNVPGVLGNINRIVSSVGANIKSQYLSTDPTIGYLVMDVEKADADKLHDEIAKLDTSIRTRILY